MKLSGAPLIPRVRPQLQNDTLGKEPPSTAGDDCNVKVTQACVEFGSGEYPSVATVRDLMGVPSGGTGSQAAIDVMQHFGCDVTRLADFAELEAAWNDPDLAVSIALSYDYINNNLPALSGSKGFRGFHRVLTWGTEQVKAPGTNWVFFDDPTHDGRLKPSGARRYPKGPVMAKRGDVEKAMTASAIRNGARLPGFFSAIAVRRMGA